MVSLHTPPKMDHHGGGGDADVSVVVLMVVGVDAKVKCTIAPGAKVYVWDLRTFKCLVICKYF